MDLERVGGGVEPHLRETQPMSRRRKAWNAAAAVAVLGGLVSAGIQLDDHLLARRQKMAQMVWEQQVRECEAQGGRWFRGECIPEGR